MTLQCYLGPSATKVWCGQRGGGGSGRGSTRRPTAISDSFEDNKGQSKDEDENGDDDADGDEVEMTRLLVGLRTSVEYHAPGFEIGTSRPMMLPSVKVYVVSVATLKTQFCQEKEDGRLGKKLAGN